MKTLIRTSLLLALIAALAPSVLASTTGFNVPDGGSTAVMVAIAFAGVAAVRKFRR